VKSRNLTACSYLTTSKVPNASRVRLIEPRESGNTTSNHRLSGSNVGSSGHCVEIEVAGDCSDEDLALIERLAQAADTQPVQVQRRRGA
jgi:hypothetical protein